MAASVRILATHGLDSSPTLMISHLDGTKILINCGEGTQRVCLESNVQQTNNSKNATSVASSCRITTIRTVCLTHLTPDAMGGLPGAMLTMADAHASGAAGMLGPALDRHYNLTNIEEGRERSRFENVNASKDDLKRQNPASRRKAKGAESSRGKLSASPVSCAPGLDVLGPVGTAFWLHSLRHFMERSDFPMRVQEAHDIDHLHPSAPPLPSSGNNCSNNTKKRTKKREEAPPKMVFRIQSIVCTHTLPKYKPIKTPNGDQQLPQRNGHPHASGHKRPHPSSISSNFNSLNHSNNNPTQRRMTLPPGQTQIVSYLITTPAIPGKFLPDKAKALGVPPGPLYGKLNAGQSITIQVPVNQEPEQHNDLKPTSPTREQVEQEPQQREVTIHSHQVVKPSSPGVAILVLAYPTHDAAQQLWNDPTVCGLAMKQATPEESSFVDDKLRRSNTDNSDDVLVDVVFHLCPNHLYEEFGPAEWHRRFGGDNQLDGGKSSSDEDLHKQLEADQNRNKSEDGKAGAPIEHVWVECHPLNIANLLGDDEGCSGTRTPYQSAAHGAQARSLLHAKIYPHIATSPPQSSQSLSSIETMAHSRVGQAGMEFVFLPRSKRGFLFPDGGANTATELEQAGLTEPAEESRVVSSGPLELVASSGALKLADQLLDRDEDKVAPMEHEGKGHEKLKASLWFAGTGAAIPCKHRNVTGMMLRQADGRSILLDVGEGTVGNLLRIHSSLDSRQTDETLDEFLASIRVVWISHPHADHHLGLLRLLYHRRRLISNGGNGEDSIDPILLVASSPIFRFVDEFASVDPSILGTYLCIDSECFREHQKNFQARIQDALGIKGCRAVRVTHCNHAYAIILDGTGFGRVVYSGDCRPSRILADAGIGADLLIHEATFEDGMEADAALKRHCTVGEALGVARESQAKTVVLTHFSQRYPKIPPLPRAYEAGDQQGGVSLNSWIEPSVIFAFDYMILCPDTLSPASKLTPALHLLYPEAKVDDAPLIENETAMTSAEEVLAQPGLFARLDFL